MDQDGSAESRNDAALGRIPLKQVRVKREGGRPSNTVNFLVPYLDLFSRLSDDELGRLAGVDPDIVAGLRKQVMEVDRALQRYVDLLPRLSDAELVRLTGATEKTIRFWRLCQPRPPSRDPQSSAAVAPEPAEAHSRPPSSSSSAPVAPAVEKKRKKRDSRAPADTPAPQSVSQPRPTSKAAEPRDAKVTINPAAQATVDAMMTFSGAPFPGYDDGESQTRPPPDEISLSDVETPDLGRV
jgi:hypothetical protein